MYNQVGMSYCTLTVVSILTQLYVELQNASFQFNVQ